MLYRFSIIAAAITLSCAGLLSETSVVSAGSQSPAAGETAHDRTVTFTIDNMTCGLCPITVKTAMAGVDGVKSVSVDFAAKTATVSYDPSVASVPEIAAASTSAGYRAEPAG